MELSNTSHTSDLVSGTGITINYGGTPVLKNLAGALLVGVTFTLLTAGTRTGSYSSVVSQTPGQTVTWNTGQLTANGTVSVAKALAAPVTLVPVGEWRKNQLCVAGEPDGLAVAVPSQPAADGPRHQLGGGPRLNGHQPGQLAGGQHGILGILPPGIPVVTTMNLGRVWLPVTSTDSGFGRRGVSGEAPLFIR